MMEELEKRTALLLSAMAYSLRYLFLSELRDLSMCSKSLAELVKDRANELHLVSTSWITSSQVFGLLASRFPHCRVFTVSDSSTIEKIEVLSASSSSFWQRIYELEMNAFTLLEDSGTHEAYDGPPALALIRIQRVVLKNAKTSVLLLLDSVCQLNNKTLTSLTLEAPLSLSPRAGLKPDGDLFRSLGNLARLESLHLSQLFVLESLCLPASVCASLRSLAVVRCARLTRIECCAILSRLGCLDVSFSKITSTSLASLVASCNPNALVSVTARHCTGLTRGLVLTHGAALKTLAFDYCSRLPSLEVSSGYLQSLSLAGCARLRTLSVCSPLLSRLSLCLLCELHFLDLKCGGLKSLDITGCQSLDGHRLRDTLPRSVRVVGIRPSEPFGDASEVEGKHPSRGRMPRSQSSLN